MLKLGSFLRLRNNYLIEKKLLDGGFSDLYLGIQLKSREKVVIKVFRNRDFENFIQEESYWRREKAFIDIQQHYSPHTMKLIEAIADKRDINNHRYLIIVSFIEGPEFYDWYEKVLEAPIPPNYYEFLVETILIPLADYFWYCHERGIIHRDFSTTNIIMTNEKNSKHVITRDNAFTSELIPVVIDWGAGRNFDPARLLELPPYMSETEGEGTKIYTPGLSPPEINESKPPLPQTDIYCFGAVMYYALTEGKYRESDLLTTDYILSPKEQNKACPDELNEIVEKCTQYEPRERYITFLELKEDLERFLYHQKGIEPDVSITFG